MKAQFIQEVTVRGQGGLTPSMTLSFSTALSFLSLLPQPLCIHVAIYIHMHLLVVSPIQPPVLPTPVVNPEYPSYSLCHSPPPPPVLWWQ